MINSNDLYIANKHGVNPYYLDQLENPQAMLYNLELLAQQHREVLEAQMIHLSSASNIHQHEHSKAR